MKHIYAALLVSFMSLPALAEPYTYSPEGCEFQTTFPEKPFIEKKCGSNLKQCVEVASYTKAVGATSSTNFRVTCNTLTQADAGRFTVEIVKETLNQLLKSNNLLPYNQDASEKDGYKFATAISISERDNKPLIYNGQIWIGKKSMFTIEAEMLGEKNDKIEETFASILRHSYPNDKKPIEKAPDKKSSASTQETKPAASK